MQSCFNLSQRITLLSFYLGFTTEGEFNSLRTMGKKRAISILELTKNARQKARQIKASVIKDYFELNRNGM